MMDSTTPLQNTGYRRTTSADSSLLLRPTDSQDSGRGETHSSRKRRTRSLHLPSLQSSNDVLGWLPARTTSPTPSITLTTAGDHITDDQRSRSSSQSGHIVDLSNLISRKRSGSQHLDTGRPSSGHSNRGVTFALDITKYITLPAVPDIPPTHKDYRPFYMAITAEQHESLVMGKSFLSPSKDTSKWEIVQGGIGTETCYCRQTYRSCVDHAPWLYGDSEAVQKGVKVDDFDEYPQWMRQCWRPKGNRWDGLCDECSEVQVPML